MLKYAFLISPLQMLLRKCANQEPSEEEELEADKYTNHIEAYSPAGNPDSPSVSMSTAIALVNRYALGREHNLTSVGLDVYAHHHGNLQKIEKCIQ